ncbi:MAG: flagellar assembly protein T N-terminal domain-containing protein [candidate division KSB1 bacterium]|nr:flagellar assembly protein T N-terminal domain-containing protein [candidate division KSB1 bacterium]MDZ7341593.1 flagellar assembly protein T N-terminal domain-containing protein [candidate division KSB1 bacterium]
MKISPRFASSALIFMALIIILVSIAAAQQPTQMVTSKGMASIFANDVALARDQATDDALRNAVEQTLGTFIQSSTLVQNNMVVEDNILSWANGYVRSYRIISEGQTDPSTYEVTIEATVELANLKNDWESIQNLLSRMGNPRLMFLIEEQNIGESRNQYDYLSVDMNITETTLLEKFIEKGFECVDPATVRENLKQEQAAAILQGDTKLAATLAKKLNAEVVITGKAIAKVATGINLGGMKSCQANVTARAIKADVATVFATSSQHAAYPHIDEVTGGTEAIKKATVKLADELMTKITQKWKDEYYKTTTVKVILQGVTSFNEVTDFSSTLKYLVRGVKEIYTREVSGDQAELDVKITGNANQLARELERKDLDKFEVKVLGLTMNKLTLKISTKTEPE